MTFIARLVIVDRGPSAMPRYLLKRFWPDGSLAGGVGGVECFVRAMLIMTRLARGLGCPVEIVVPEVAHDR